VRPFAFRPLALLSTALLAAGCGARKQDADPDDDRRFWVVADQDGSKRRVNADERLRLKTARYVCRKDNERTVVQGYGGYVSSERELDMRGFRECMSLQGFLLVPKAQFDQLRPDASEAAPGSDESVTL